MTAFNGAGGFLRNSSGVRKFPHAGKRTHVPNRLNPPKKKKWFKVLRAVQYNIRGRVIYRLFSHARVAC